MRNKKKLAIILLNNGRLEICKFTDLVKIKDKRLSSNKKNEKYLFIKKCNKETVKLIAVHCKLSNIKLPLTNGN